MKYMDCGPIDRSFMAWGQSNEDVKIYHRFFKNASYINNGFFLEMGGLDGLTFSNTLIYEHCFGWRGMLIEANMLNFLEMNQNRPCTHNVWSAACPRGRSYLQMEGYNGTSKIIAGDILSGNIKWFIFSLSSYYNLMTWNSYTYHFSSLHTYSHTRVHMHLSMCVCVQEKQQEHCPLPAIKIDFS